jgi:hypothetical protein
MVVPVRLSRGSRRLNHIDRASFRFRYFRHGCSSLTSRPDDETNQFERAARCPRHGFRAAANDRRSTESFDLYRESAWGAAMSSTDTLERIPPRTSERAAPRAFISLIEIPDASRPLSARARFTGSKRWDSGQPSRMRTKRRLRREVRLAGYAFLALTPLLAACSLSQPDRPVRVLACSIAEATAGDRVYERRENPRFDAEAALDSPVNHPRDLILSSGAPDPQCNNDSEVPIVFPGYVLPDDSHEESTHEGS